MSENQETPKPENSNPNPSPQGPGKPKLPLPKKPFKPRFTIYWVWGFILVALIAIEMISSMNFSEKEINFQYFQDSLLNKHYVDKIQVVNNDVAEITLNQAAFSDPKFKSFSHTPPQFTIKILDRQSFHADLAAAEATFKDSDKIEAEPSTRADWTGILGWALPVVVMVLLWFLFMRRMGGGGGNQIFSIGKSKATLFDKDTNVNITFNDVAGLEEAKVEIKEIVDFLKNPQKYVALGAKIPKGALLVGPPGTGKTLLAKAVAGEAKVPFFSLSGSDFVEMFVGVGASRVRDLFRQAKEKAPCIIFIDEVDAIGRARGRNLAQGANDERENTLNQLLTEMDGFTNTAGIIILAATNRADVLDRALLRPGRFDRQIYVDMPDLIERKEIFKVHLKPLKIDTSVDIDFLAKQTPGFSGADIANVCNEAALIAARYDKKVIDKQDFLDAVDRVVGGLEKKNRLISPSEKKVIAYHEAGHAVASWLLEFAHPLVKVTIIPRGKSLGAAWYLPEERSITTTEQLMDEMCAALGGRAAEEITFGKISTGALSDLEKVTKQAYAMVTYYGLSEKVGNVSYYDSSGNTEYSFQKPYSEKTAELIDAEVNALIASAYIKAKKILTEHRDQLALLANLLLEKEVMFKEDLETIIGKRPYEVEVATPVSKRADIYVKKAKDDADAAKLAAENGAKTNGASNGNGTPVNGIAKEQASVVVAPEPVAAQPKVEVTNGEAKEKPVEEKKPKENAQPPKDDHPTLF